MVARVTRWLMAFLLIAVLFVCLAPALIGRWNAIQLRRPSIKASHIQTHWWTTSAIITLPTKQPLPFNLLIGIPKPAFSLQLIIHHGPFVSYDLNQTHHWRFAKNLIEIRAPDHWQSPIVLIQHWNGTIEGFINIQRVHWKNLYSNTSIANVKGHLTWVQQQSFLAHLFLQKMIRHYDNQLVMTIDQDNNQTTQHLIYHRWHGVTEHQILTLDFMSHHQPILRIERLHTINEIIHQQSQVHHRFLLQSSAMLFASQRIGPTSLLATVTTPDFQTLKQSTHCLTQSLHQIRSPLVLGSSWRLLIPHCIHSTARLDVKATVTLNPKEALRGSLIFNPEHRSLTLELPQDWLLEQLTDYYQAQSHSAKLATAEQHAKQKLHTLLLTTDWHQAPANKITYHTKIMTSKQPTT